MNGNNIRSPNNIFVCWFFIFGLVFVPKNVFAYPIGNTNTSYIDNVISSCKERGYSYVVYELKTKVGDDKEMDSVHCAYSSSPVAYVDGVGFTGTFVSKYEGWHYRLNCISSSESGLPNTVYEISFDPSFYNSSPTTCYSFTLLDVYIVDYAEGSDVYGSLDYDKNDLKSYPLDTVCVTSPEGNIKTNSNYYTFTFKGKIKLEDGDIEESVTPQIISKFIRNKFRYDFKSDKENLTGLSCLGAFKIDKEDSFTDEVMLRNLIDGKITFHNEKYDVIDYVDDFSCGVGGDFKSWNSKGYYNFVVNTSIYVGDSPGANEYKFYFTVPYKFKGIFSYKTITVNYSLERGIYSDDDFDGIDDTSLEVIPDSEIEIIHPGFVYPSTSTPNNTFNDGDVIQNNNNNVLINNGSSVSEAERNGILNMLDNCLRTTTGRLKSLGTSLVGFKDSMTGLFSFLPQDIVNLFYLGLSMTVIFFIFSLRR